MDVVRVVVGIPVTMNVIFPSTFTKVIADIPSIVAIEFTNSSQFRGCLEGEKADSLRNNLFQGKWENDNIHKDIV